MQPQSMRGIFPVSGKAPLGGVPKGTLRKKYPSLLQIQRNSGNRGEMTANNLI